VTQLLVFDWDGTLIDSAARIIDCMQRAAADCALPQPGAEAVRNIIGLGLPEALAMLYPGISAADSAQMRKGYSSHFLAAGQEPCPLFPGVAEGLERLAARGFLLTVATGKSRRGLDRAFQESGIGRLFVDSRCADETQSKPHPQMLLELLVATGVSADGAVMVGDTEYDLAMAVEAGVASVGVSYGAHSVERLQRHGPLDVIDHFCELEALLPQGR